LFRKIWCWLNRAVPACERGATPAHRHFETSSEKGLGMMAATSEVIVFSARRFWAAP
jgi:hypothetical protein